MLGTGVFQQLCLGRHSHGLENQRRVGGGVLRRKTADLLKIAGVGDHGGILLEGIELVHGQIIPNGVGKATVPRVAPHSSYS